VSTANLTLYGLEATLMRLMFEREELVAEGLSVIEKDIEIREYVSKEIRKVDGVCFYLREFEARAAAAKEEAKRLRARADAWEARHDRLEEMVKSVMLMSGKARLDGDSNTLRLVKNPSSVEIAQPELVPDEYQKVVVTMPHSLWARVVRAIPEALLLEVGEHSKETSEPMKSMIAEALKQKIPCTVCDGVGVREVYAGDGDKVDQTCLACKGTGKVNQGVPGCSLVTDKMSLRVE
jgi:hypothetical protein